MIDDLAGEVGRSSVEVVSGKAGGAYSSKCGLRNLESLLHQLGDNTRRSIDPTVREYHSLVSSLR